MAVAALESNWTESESSGGSNPTHSHADPGTGDYVVVIILYEDSVNDENDISSATLGGQSLTKQIDEHQVGGAANANGVIILGMNETNIDAMSGSSLSLTWDANGIPNDTIKVYSRYFSGVDQSTPWAGSSAGSAASGGVQWAASVSYTDGDMGLYGSVEGAGSNTPSVDESYSEDQEDLVNSSMYTSCGVKAFSGSGSTQPTVTWGGTSRRVNAGGVLNAAAGGGATAPPGTPVVDIDTGNDGTWAAGDDKTADVRAFPGVTLRRGYNVTGLPPQPAVGRAQYHLDNSDGTYDDDAAHGVGRNDPTRIQHVYDSTTYNLWRGRIRSLAQLPNVDQQVLAIDALDTLSPGPNRAGFSTSVYTSITTNTAISHVLDAIGIPAALGSSGGKLDTGNLTLPYFWLGHDDDPFSVLTQVCNAEGPKARLYVDGSGVVNFEANDYRTGTTRSTTLQETFRGATTEPIVSRVLRKEDGIDGVINKVAIPWNTLGVATADDIEFVGSNTGESTSATSLSSTAISGLRAGDIVLMQVDFSSSSVSSVSSTNHTAIAEGAYATQYGWVGWRRVTEADLEDADALSWTTTTNAYYVTAAYRGVIETGLPYDDAAGTSRVDDASPAVASITVDGVYRRVVAFASTSFSVGDGVDPPTGYTSRVVNDHSDISQMADATVATTGAITPEWLNGTSTDDSFVSAIILIPARVHVWEYSGDLVLGNNEAVTIVVESGGLPYINAVTPVEDDDFTISAGALSAGPTLDQTSGTRIKISMTADSAGATIQGPTESTSTGIRLKADQLKRVSSGVSESEDSTSQTAYEERGLRGYPTWKYLDESDAQALADDIVSDFKDPRELVVFRVHGDRDDAALKATLEREISDRVRILTTRGGIDVTGWVERIDHRIGQRGFVTTDLAIWETV